MAPYQIPEAKSVYSILNDKIATKNAFTLGNAHEREREREFISPKLPQNGLWRVKVYLYMYIYVRQTDPNNFMLTQQT